MYPTSVKRLAVFVTLSLATLPMLAAEAAEKTTAGKVTDVTLYRGQALVTREVPLAAGAGDLELVVSDLPDQIVGTSLYAESDEAVQVRAVRYRTRAVGEEPREELRSLDEKIAEKVNALTTTKSLRQVTAERIAYLDNLDNFVAPTAQVELTKGVLDAETLERITEFSFEAREAAAERILELDRRQRELQAEIVLLQRQRQELAAGSSKTVREAVLFLVKDQERESSIRLSYLVSGCGWSPSYNFRGQPGGEKIRVEYNAIVRQLSGEDWNDVALTLSTASPALSAKGPGLAPFHLTLQAASQTAARSSSLPSSSMNFEEQLKSIKGRRRKAERSQSEAIGLGDNLQMSLGLNAAANDYQGIELLAGQEMLHSLQQGVSEDDGPSLSYALSGQVSMESRSDQQIVRIMGTTLDADIYHVATPILTNYVFREAELVNSGDQDFLRGPASVYLDGRFVGRTEIPTITRGQTFVLGLGADPQLRTRRELVKKEEAVQGGNREFSFAYRLIIENYKTQAVDVRVLDRLPYSLKESEVRVTLGEMSDKLSENSFYLRREKPKGILRWQVEVPAGAAGEDAAAVEYAYRIEFDRNLVLATPGQVTGEAAAPFADEQLESELESLEKLRNYQQ